MKHINSFLSCPEPEYCRQADYLLEFKLCRGKGYTLCTMKLWVTGLGNVGLTKKVASLYALPRLNDSGDELLSIKECQQLHDECAALKEELKDLRRIRDGFNKNDTDLVLRGKRDAKLLKGVNWSKVRGILTYSHCGALRRLFSCFG